MDLFTKKLSINKISDTLKIDSQNLIRWKYFDNTKHLSPLKKRNETMSTDEYIDYLNENVQNTETHQENVLIIDDDESIFFALKQFLAKFNFNAIWAKNGFEACYLLKLHNPKIITLDLKMQEYNGNDFLKMIDKIHLTLKPWIIVVSADKNDMIYKSLDNGADFFLRKPLKKSDFFKIINKAALESTSNI